jgi:hypothetical protein
MTAMGRRGAGRLYKIAASAVFTFTSVGAWAVSTVRCVYLQESSPSGFSKMSEPSVMTFILDKDKDAAYVTGNNGSNPVDVQVGLDGALTFTEITATGAHQVTAIDSRGRAAHSRHTIINGKLVPSQMYGACTMQ